MSSPAVKQSSSSPWSLKFVAALVALPYLAGYFLSARNLDQVQHFLAPLFSALHVPSSSNEEGSSAAPNNRVLHARAPPMDVEACYGKLVKQLTVRSAAGNNDNNLQHFDQLSVVLHRNGQADACGVTPSNRNLALAFRSVLSDMQQAGLDCPSKFEKYEVEALLTRLFHELATASPTTSCHSQEEPDRSPELGLYGFCDMGEAKTPILMDHQKLVPIVNIDQSTTPLLPCHFHSANGVRITSLQQLSDLAAQAVVPNNTSNSNQDNNCSAEEETCTAPSLVRELHLYAVPAGRVFLHSAAHVGQIIDLPHVKGGDPNKPVYLEVLSVSPAVFDLHNFFTRAESQDLVDRALAETKESHRIKRSTTGNVGAQINQRRTSESGYDTDGKTSMLVKK